MTQTTQSTKKNGETPKDDRTENRKRMKSSDKRWMHLFLYTYFVKVYTYIVFVNFITAANCVTLLRKGVLLHEPSYTSAPVSNLVTPSKLYELCVL